MSWDLLLTVEISKKGILSVRVGPVLLILFIVFLVGIAIYGLWRRKSSSAWAPVEANISLGQLGNVRIAPSYGDIQIAHKAWVELASRKAGIPFDEQNDVIVEVYDSWYALFAEMRNLAKLIPADKVRKNESTKELVHLLIDALNQGLRPHLTCWQAKFRRWYESEIAKHPEKTPQEIQKLHPQYQELVEDLRNVNRELIQYTSFIKEVAQGRM